MSRSVILFLAANPVGSTAEARVSLDQECAAVERELKMTARRDHFEFLSKWAVTVDDMFRHLLDVQPTIIHFSGNSGATGLVLVGDQGQPQPVKPAALAQMIKTTATRARLAVLNACYSEDQAKALRDAVGCAIGMGGTISDYDARTFSVGFYRALGYGRTVGNAYQQALATLAGKDLPGQSQPRCLVRPGIDVDALRLDEDAPEVPAVSGARPAGGPQTLVASRPPATQGTSQPSGARPTATAAEGYDLFLAHPSANKPSARALYDLLQPDVRVFFDERSLQPSARWDQEVPAAQCASWATVILISSHSDAAWYLGDEIITAIALHRSSPEVHLVVPVLLEPGIAVPYGLNHVQTIDATAVGGLAGVADLLRKQVARMHGRVAPLPIESLSTGSGPASCGNGRGDHFRLHDRLCQLTDITFEQIVFHAGIERASIAPRTAPLAERVLDVAQLAALDQVLCRRISAELDRRAPWTRP